MAITQEQADSLASQYGAGTLTQDTINSSGLTQADIAQYYPNFDISTSGFSLPSGMSGTAGQTNQIVGALDQFNGVQQTGQTNDVVGAPSPLASITPSGLSNADQGSTAPRPFADVVGPLSPSQQHDLSLYDQTGNLKAGLTSLLADNTISKEEADQIKAYADQYKFTADDISRVTGTPIQKVQEVLSAPERYAQEGYNKSLVDQTPTLKTNIANILQDGTVSQTEANDVTKFMADTGFKPEDVARVTGIPIETINDLIGRQSSYASQVIKDNSSNLLGLANYAIQNGLTAKQMAEASGGKFTEQQAQSVLDKAGTYAGQLELASPEGYNQIKGIINRAVNKDYGGKEADWMYQMFTGLSPEDASVATKQLEFGDPTTKKVSAWDDNGLYEYDMVVPAAIKEGQGVEPIYTDVSAGESPDYQITGYRQKIDSDTFGSGDRAIYANYDATGKLIGYDSDASIYTGDRTLYRGSWDANGKATPNFINKGRGGFGGFIDDTIGGVKDMVGPELWTLAKFTPAAPYVFAADAIDAASRDQWGNAALSALGSYGAYQSDLASGMQDVNSVNAINGADLASDVATLGSNPYITAQTNALIANTAAAAIPAFKAAEDGNYTQIGALAAGVISNPALASKFDFNTNPNAANAMYGLSAYSAYQNNDLAGMIGAASGLVKSPDLKLAASATRFLDAARSGNSNAMISATNAFGSELSANDRTKTYVENAKDYLSGLIPKDAKDFANGTSSGVKDLFNTTKTDVKTAIDSLKTSTSDAAKVFQDSIRAGATEEEAYNAAKLYDGKITWDPKAASTITPNGPSDKLSGLTGVDLTDISSGVQVAGPGGFDQGGFKPGTPTQTATGMFFTTPDGKTYPVTVNKETGMMSTTDPAGVDELKQFRINDTSKIKDVFFDKTPIDPNLSTGESEALKNVTGKSSGDITDVEAKNASPEVQKQAEDIGNTLAEKIRSGASMADMLRMVGGLDTAENATALYIAKQLPELRDLMKNAQNSGYVRDLEEHLATDPTDPNWLQEYKGLTGKDYAIPSMGEIVITGQRPIGENGATEGAGDITDVFNNPLNGNQITTQIDSNTGFKTVTEINAKNGASTQTITTPTTITSIATNPLTNTAIKTITDVATNTSTKVKIDLTTGVVTLPSADTSAKTDTATKTTTDTSTATKDSKSNSSGLKKIFGAGFPLPVLQGYIPPPLKEQFLHTSGTQEAFQNPLEDLLKYYGGGTAAEQSMNDIDPQLAAVLSQRLGVPSISDADQSGGLPSSDANHFTYGQEDSIDSLLGNTKSPSNDPANLRMADGGYVQPLTLAPGGMASPLMAATGGLPAKAQGREDFRTSKHVAGEGDGHSDDIPAMLADGEFVFSADVVSALGNGSTKAGSDKLYKMVEEIRKRARSTSPDKLAPPALKSPLDYLKGSKK